MVKGEKKLFTIHEIGLFFDSAVLNQTFLRAVRGLPGHALSMARQPSVGLRVWLTPFSCIMVMVEKML